MRRKHEADPERHDRPTIRWLEETYLSLCPIYILYSDTSELR